MELDWSTIVLEMVNFGVLVWLLHRLLYRPVLNVIAQRRAAIESQTTEARRIRNEADGLRAQYDGRLQTWEEERAQARRHLAEELQKERVRRLAELQTSLDQEREKRRVVDERRQQEDARQAEEQAMTQSAQFAAKLLARVADPALEARLTEAALADLQTLPDGRLTRLREAIGTGAGEATITSAYPIPESRRRVLVDRLTAVLGRTPHCVWREDVALVAGLRITIGPIVLGANLHDELRFFTEVASNDAISSVR
ncbi:ATP synthase subunit b [Nitrospira sp.]|nr:ATP synthase subunit b [Nitrospira sp.]